jgi:small subunit ribosomal protein S1
VKVIKAKKAGFCSGVSKAFDRLIDQSSRVGEGSVLGDLVHNEQVVDYLTERAIKKIDQPEDACGSYLAIRTHGATPQLLANLEKMANLEIIDLTCPRVKRVQEIASELADRNIKVVIFGNRNHPEVEGLVGWAGADAVVVANIEELEELVIDQPAALIAQTTCDPDLYGKAQKIFRDAHLDGMVYNTICPETRLRQDEVLTMAERVDAFVVVGSANSANTMTLYDRCRQLKPACRVNSARELERSFLNQFAVIGVTAGASTPPWMIKEVVESMENENAEVQNEEQFQFDEEIKVAQVGEQVTGKVARVTDEEVFVDIGSKSEAVLPVGEVHLEQGKTLSDLFAPEDEIEVTVIEDEEQEGKVVVSHKRLARDKRINELLEAHENGTVTSGMVKQVVNAGLVLDLGAGVEGFMPGSLVDTSYIQDFAVFKDQPLEFKVIEFDRDKTKLILNRKTIMEEVEAVKKEETLKAIKVGSVISGTVKRLTNFGAFVDIGGIDGLVHVSEISWERVNHPGEVLKAGEKLDVEVLEVIPEKERISLSIRKTLPDPWLKSVEGLESGQVVTGKVTRLTNFGAFIEIKPGLEGLAHISQLADFHVKHPSEVLQEKDEIEVKILEIKPKNKRISLSVTEAGGAAYNVSTNAESGADNGNVTLGDLFGDLFENSNQDTGEEPSKVLVKAEEVEAKPKKVKAKAEAEEVEAKPKKVRAKAKAEEAEAKPEEAEAKPKKVKAKTKAKAEEVEAKPEEVEVEGGQE